MSQPALEEQLEPTPADSAAVARARSSWELFRARFAKDKAAVAGVVMIAILVVLGLLAPLFARLTGHGPNELFQSEMLEPTFGLPKGPNSEFWFGADSVGRDLFVRVMYGARTSLTVAVVATGLATLVGVVLGMLAGYRGGVVDTIVSRSADIVLSLPILLFAIGIATVCSITARGCLGGLLKP
jgi:peptide/nickel transport system permease protein